MLTLLQCLENLACGAVLPNCQLADLVFGEDRADLSPGRPNLVSGNSKLHLPAVYLCAQEFGRSGGDHRTFVGMDAEAEAV